MDQRESFNHQECMQACAYASQYTQKVMQQYSCTCTRNKWCNDVHVCTASSVKTFIYMHRQQVAKQYSCTCSRNKLCKDIHVHVQAATGAMLFRCKHAQQVAHWYSCTCTGSEKFVNELFIINLSFFVFFNVQKSKQFCRFMGLQFLTWTKEEDKGWESLR